MKAWTVLLFVLLAGCSWFHRKPKTPPPSEYIVTGAPAEALILLDGAPQGEPVVAGRAHVMAATPGYHLVEVKVGDTVTYREQTYLALGEHHFVQVLTSRN